MRATRIIASLLVAGACQRAPSLSSAPVAAAIANAAPIEFARTVAELSEPSGYFDSDNLVTNETSYLHVVGQLKRLGVQGGAYIGVGPDQNFSYIAAIRPEVAFMLDIRRDNMLEHLMFKALFGQARNRAEYLALLTGRPVPTNLDAWNAKSIADLVAHFDTAKTTPESEAAARRVVNEGVRRPGVPLDSSDLATIRRFHDAFILDGLQIRYESRGRPGRGFFPSLHELLLARDIDGSEAGYLAGENDFQFVKQMQMNDRIIPVTGDLAGPKALTGIGTWVRTRGSHVSALYTSNAEDYVMRGGAFPGFARNVLTLPRDAKSVIIRSYFGGFRGPHPYNVNGFRSTQLLQPLDVFAATTTRGGYTDYFLLVTDGALDPKR